MRVYVLCEDWQNNTRPHCIGTFTNLLALISVLEKNFPERNWRGIRKIIKEKGYASIERRGGEHRISIWERQTVHIRI
jgi:hypothetical protein